MSGHMGKRAAKGNDREPDPKGAHGAPERTLGQLERWMSDPNRLMVAERALESTRGLAQPLSKMFADGSHKVRVVSYLAERGRTATLPKTGAGIIDALGDFFAFCADNYVPPTFGMFSTWNGLTTQRINQIERGDDERAEAVAFAKECIRSFLELSAMESSVNPVVYFHQQAVDYGKVQEARVIVTEDNTRELPPEERAERRRLLLQDGSVVLEQDGDGVYRVPEEVGTR